jgi:DNA-binding ferritin-like protein
MRDSADVYQLVCLANLETHNAEFIEQGLTQAERIYKLNTIAIRQMKSLTTNIQVKSLDQKSKKMIESKEEGI